MLEIAEDVFQISVFPRKAVNAYLIGSIIVDAGVRSSAADLKKALGKRSLSTHILTHAHADHQGSSAFLCDTFRLPLWCGAPDAAAAQTGQVTGEYRNPRHPIAQLQQQNRQSIRKIAALKPRVTGFGHGPVLRDTDELLALAARLGP